MDDSYFGILLHWTRSAGIGGAIKQKLEDFVVEEVADEIPAGKGYVAFLVEKRGLDTFETIQKISRALRVNRRAIAYAGLKDRYAVTRQWMSVAGVSEASVQQLDIPGVAILKTKSVEDGVHLGGLVGNRFTVTIRGITLGEKETNVRLSGLVDEIAERGVPNFFGPQRFGQNRPITHAVGKKIIQGDFDGAVFNYLTLDAEGETANVREARRRLSEEKDFKSALGYFPRGLTYERMLLTVLSDGDGSIKALRALPAGLNRLFVDAYQSYLFNLSLSRFLQNNDSVENFPAPVVGYKTLLSSKEFDVVVAGVLEAEGVSEENFFIPRVPELSAKGTLRSAMIYPNIAFSASQGSAKLTFELKKGSYATVVLREIMNIVPP
ncbi:MAG: tRNA pseudouridine(13) synthase TruD [Candidatus Aenigmarchaeota archaeon]|nr:tRNA pseudouridine(13) synthase TruD [Candidatus Aenigmarchaeota archaeon]